MSYLFIFLSILFVTDFSDPEPQTLNISTTAEVQLPANRIQFNITLNARAESAQEAYEMHQQKEKVLVQLLEQYNISEEDIRYEPISIREDRDYNDSGVLTASYVTRQTVNVTFSNFDIYEEIQISLIENDFDNFDGIFLTSKKKAGKDKALRKAIQKAKAKAALIAEEAGVELGKIKQITYNAQRLQPYAGARVEMKVASDGLLEYDQTVTISTSVTMEFFISNRSGESLTVTNRN